MNTSSRFYSTYFRAIKLIDDNPEVPLEPVSVDSPTPVDVDNKPINDSTVDITVDVSPGSPQITRPDVVEEQEYVSPETIDAQMQTVFYRLDYIESLLKIQDGIGQEGLTDVLKRALFGLLNVIGHVVNLFKTGLFYGWRDFKRSELQEYCDSNFVTYKVIMDEDNFNLFRTLKVECPRGMMGMYRPAVDALLKYLNSLAMGSRADQLKAMVKDIFDNVCRNTLQMSSYVRRTNGELLPRQLADDYTTLGKKYFTSGSRDRDDFEKLFDSVSDVYGIVEIVKAADSHLREVAVVHDRLMDINEIVNEMITNHSDNINATQVKDLVSIIRAIAFSFDRYSVVVTDLSRIGHNLTLDLRRMRDAKNL